MEQFYIPLSFSHTAHSPLQHFVEKNEDNKKTTTTTKIHVYLFKEAIILRQSGPPWYTFEVRNLVSTFAGILFNPSTCVLQRLGRLKCLFNLTTI